MSVRLPEKNIHIGEVAVHCEPVVIRTTLGSCVSACLYDPAIPVGGMNHFLLPQTGSKASTSPEARFGVHAMELLINEMMKLGADKKRIVAKGFGGANVIPGMSSPTVGELNVAFLKRFLETEKINLVSHHFGGICARQVYFYPHSGRAFVRKVCHETEKYTIQEEQNALANTGEVTLF